MGSTKNFLWASRLWVGRRKKRISSYKLKSDKKKELRQQGLNKMRNSWLINPSLLDGINKKNSYKRRDYESVDENSVSRVINQKLMRKEFRQLRVKYREKY